MGPTRLSVSLENPRETRVTFHAAVRPPWTGTARRHASSIQFRRAIRFSSPECDKREKRERERERESKARLFFSCRHSQRVKYRAGVGRTMMRGEEGDSFFFIKWRFFNQVLTGDDKEER